MIRPPVILWTLAVTGPVTAALAVVGVGFLARHVERQADQIEELQAEVSALHAAVHGKVRTFQTAAK